MPTQVGVNQPWKTVFYKQVLYLGSQNSSNGYKSVGGVTVSIVAFQAIDPGSTPGQRSLFFS